MEARVWRDADGLVFVATVVDAIQRRQDFIRGGRLTGEAEVAI